MKGSTVIAFITGVCAGASGAYLFLKKKQEVEIEQFKAEYSNYKESANDISPVYPEIPEEESKPAPVMKSEMHSYMEKKKERQYVDYSTQKEGADEKSNKKEEEAVRNRPMLIEYEDFGEDFDTESLVYFADGTLADDRDNPVEDVENVVGLENLTHFGDDPQDPDTIYVRNFRLEIDYEITRDLRNYTEVAGL